MNKPMFSGNVKPGQKLEIEFPDGLSLDEGVGRATEWWNDVGRIIMKQAWEQAEKANDEEMSANDGLHRALLFNQLNVREQHKVVMMWYRHKWLPGEGIPESEVGLVAPRH